LITIDPIILATVQSHPEWLAIIEKVVEGTSVQLLAHDFHVSKSAIDYHITQLRELFNVSSTPVALAMATSIGLISPFKNLYDVAVVNKFQKLDARCRLTIELLTYGFTTLEVAKAIGYSTKTVEAIVPKIYPVVGCQSRITLLPLWVWAMKVRLDLPTFLEIDVLRHIALQTIPSEVTAQLSQEGKGLILQHLAGKLNTSSTQLVTNKQMYPQLLE